MIEVILLLVFLTIFFFLYERDKKDRDREDTIRKTFENTLQGIFTSVEKTNNTFYEMVSNIEIEHFKQLEKSTDKQHVFMAHQIDKFLEALEKKNIEKQAVIDEITRIDTEEKNAIEKEEDLEDPLAEFDPANFKNIKHVQFEGEEEIFPVTSE